MDGQVMLARLQAAMGLGHGRIHLILGHVAIDIQMETAMVGVALSAETLVSLGQDMDGGVFQPVVAADAVNYACGHCYKAIITPWTIQPPSG